MSSVLMGAVLSHGPSSGPLSYALLAIADNADDHGLAWPSIETIASKCRCDKRTTIRHIQALEASGWITVQRRVLKGKGSVYIVDIEKLGVKLNSKSRRNSFWDELEALLKTRAASRKGAFKWVPEKKSGDKMSPENLSLFDESGDKTSKSQVTIPTKSGDILSKPFNVLNRKEPSLNQKTTPQPPLQGGSLGDDGPVLPFADCRHGDPGFDLSLGIAARWVMDEAGLIRAQRGRAGGLEEVIAGALRWAARKDRIPLDEAARVALANYEQFCRDKDLMIRPWGVEKFFAQKHWAQPRTWPYDPAKRNARTGT